MSSILEKANLDQLVARLKKTLVLFDLLSKQPCFPPDQIAQISRQARLTQSILDHIATFEAEGAEPWEIMTSILIITQFTAIQSVKAVTKEEAKIIGEVCGGQIALMIRDTEPNVDLSTMSDCGCPGIDHTPKPEAIDDLG